MLLALIVSLEYYVATMIEGKINTRKMEEIGQVIELTTMPKRWETLTFYIPCIMVTLNYTWMNLMFLNIALVDIVRRNY